ncbi:MAG: cyclic pyranopterin monophosphate synthase MoaC [Candidatus Bathyarchaeia archaeon]
MKNLKRVQMVDITQKKDVYREATAQARIKLKKETIDLIKNGNIEKGDPILVAEVAAILAAKNTSQIIPLCHPIPITGVETKHKIYDEYLEVEVKVKTTAKTGVEMEALSAATAYMLTIWDMVKKYEKDELGQYPNTIIEYIKVKEKVKGVQDE